METVREYLSWLALKLGLKTSRLDQLKKSVNRLEESLRTLQDKERGLKGDIDRKNQEVQAVLARYDAASGIEKQTLEGRVAQTGKELDRRLGRLGIIQQQIKTVSSTLDNIRNIIDATGGGVETELVDDVADQLRDALESLKDNGLATEELDKIAPSMEDKQEDRSYIDQLRKKIGATSGLATVSENAGRRENRQRDLRTEKERE